MRWRPLRNNVIIKPIHKEEVTKGGIYLPPRSQSEKREGLVVRLSNSYDGELKVGDKVIYNYMSGEVIMVDREKYRIVPTSVVIGVMED